MKYVFHFQMFSKCFPFGSKSEINLSPLSNPIQYERKLNTSFPDVNKSCTELLKYSPPPEYCIYCIHNLFSCATVKLPTFYLTAVAVNLLLVYKFKFILNVNLCIYYKFIGRFINLNFIININVCIYYKFIGRL